MKVTKYIHFGRNLGMKSKIRFTGTFLLTLLLIFSMFSCSAKSGSDSQYTENKAPAENADVGGAAGSGGKENETLNNGTETERKIVKKTMLTLESKTFDDAVNLIYQYVQDNGGYIESSNITGSSYSQSAYRSARNATFTIRIPEASLEGYVSSLSSNFNVTSKKESAEDISDTYYDTEARLNAYKVQEQRLLEMLSKSTTLDYMLQLEKTLADVRYNIESLTAKIRRFDSLVSYATVNITLNEVLDYTNTATPKTFMQRMGVAFTDGWSSFAKSTGNFLVGITYMLPGLLLTAVIVVAVVLIVRKSKKRRRIRIQELYNNAAKEEQKKQ